MRVYAVTVDGAEGIMRPLPGPFLASRPPQVPLER
jgi:hypothetical protein